MADWARAITRRTPDLAEADPPLGKGIAGLGLGMGAFGKTGLVLQAPLQDNLPLE
jgi:hypothetical protein